MIKTIIKRDGSTEPFNPAKLNTWGEWASKSLGSLVDWPTILLDTVSVCKEETTSTELQNKLIQTCLDNNSWSYYLMAGRLYIAQVYKDVLGTDRPEITVNDLHFKLYKAGLMELMDYSDEEYEYANSLIDHSLDLKEPHFALHQIRKKYSLRNKTTGEEFETPQFVYMRMAMSLAEDQPKERRMKDIAKWYKYFSEKKLNPPTPNYLNLGTPHRGFASCCVYKAGDTAKSLAIGDHIAYTMTYMSAGIGSYLQTRSIEDSVRSGSIVHQGKLPYFRSLEKAVAANVQSGRGGAATTYFSAFDPEVKTIIPLKNPMSTEDKKIRGIDYTMQMNSFFAKMVAKNEKVFLFNVHTAPDLVEAMFSGDVKKFTELYLKYDSDANFPKTYESARELLINQVNESYETGRAYMMWTDEVNRHTPHKDPIYSNNLCFTGETLVAVADGRNAIDIKTLAEESEGVKSFPVYCARQSLTQSEKRVTEVKNAVAFKSGFKKVVKIVLSDGSSFKCTEDHELALDGSGWVEAKDSLGKDLESFYTSLGNTRKYRHINSFSNGHAKQHLMVWKHFNGEVPEGFNIDHIENEAVDSLDNLQLLSKEEHWKKTGEEFSGSNNASYKIHDQEYYLNERRKNSTLEGNTKYLGLSNKDLYDIACKLDDTGKKITYKNMRAFDERCPTSFSKNRFNRRIGNLIEMVKNRTFVEEVIEFPSLVKKKKSVYKGEGTLKVIEVIFTEEEEDVYDLTVEDNHNFYIITKTEDSQYLQCSGVLVHNCLETAFPTKAYNSMEDLYSLEDHGRGEVGMCSLAGIISGNIESQEEYEDVSYYALLMIDKCIHRSHYELPHVGVTAKSRMNAGVGLIGTAHHLAKEGVYYDSQEGRDLLHNIAETHAYSLIKASLKLGKELGNAPWMSKTKWPEGWLPIDTYKKSVDSIVANKLEYDWESLREEIIKNGGIRNSSLINHMPSESSSKASATTNGVYPIRRLAILKGDGDNVVYWACPDGEKLKKYYKSVWDTSTKDIINTYAIIQKFTDQSISADEYRRLQDDETVGTDEIIDNYLYFTKMGVKSRYYLNTHTASSIHEEDVEIIEDSEDEECETCKL